MRLRKYNKSLGWLSLFAGTVLLSGCNSALLDPKGQIGLEQRSLILTAFGLMLIVVIPAILMAVGFAWKYRASNKDAKYSPNWSHSNKVEAVVWTVPILIIIFLAVLTWKTTHALEPSKPLAHDEKPITIEVVSMDWKWFFIYPEQGIATVNEIAFPANTPVYFKVIATPDRAAFDQWVAKAKQSPNTMSDMAAFEKLAAPSEYNQVEYFSNVKPDLFADVINKFMAHGKSMDMTQPEGEHSAHEGMEGMDMSHAESAH